MDSREQKAFEIAAKSKLKRKGNTWIVPSQAGPKNYIEALAKGYLSKMPSYNSIFDYLKMGSLTPCLKHLIAESAMPLKPIETAFAVDSSGFSTTRFQHWFDVK